MTYIYAFLFCGLVCMIAQLILDNSKLTPGHVTSLFVVIGAALDVAGIYDKIILYAGAGALLPITSFGHLLIHGAMETASDLGTMGLAFGVFNLTSAGISLALFLSSVHTPFAIVYKFEHPLYSKSSVLFQKGP